LDNCRGNPKVYFVDLETDYDCLDKNSDILNSRINGMNEKMFNKILLLEKKTNDNLSTGHRETVKGALLRREL